MLLACSHEPPAAAPGAEAATAAHSAAAVHDDHGHAPAAHGDGHGHSARDSASSNKNRVGGKEQAGAGFAVPFVWETSKADPLAVARGHLKEILTDNASYVSTHPKPEPAKITGTARTTIVTCSDAAVQLDALDRTPENDTFVTRNWGNLLESSLGTVTYGIEQLKTPVLLIVGHTGCEAVKAVIERTKFSKPVRSQLSKLKVEAKGEDAPTLDAAVIDNVNRQVQKAVQRFQPLVRTGSLTVIGAVYDPLNTLGRGQGRLSIINVNTITDPVSMAAFVTAVTHDDKIVQALEVEHQEHDNEHDDHANEDHGAPEHHGSHQDHGAGQDHGADTDHGAPQVHGAKEKHVAREQHAAHDEHTSPKPDSAAKPGATPEANQTSVEHGREDHPTAPGAHATPARHSGGVHPAKVAAHAPSNDPSADQPKPGTKSSPPKGLPQIDHLEPSLISSPHDKAAHAEHDRGQRGH